MATGENVTCEICHEPWNAKEFGELEQEYHEQIYRPGEDVGDLESMTDEERQQRRKEIEELFARE